MCFTRSDLDSVMEENNDVDIMPPWKSVVLTMGGQEKEFTYGGKAFYEIEQNVEVLFG